MLPPAGSKPVDVERVRDLLGLVRLLFAHETTSGSDAVRLKALEEAGRLVRVAFDQARCRPDTLGYRAAPMNLAKGLELLGAITWGVGEKELLEAARQRLKD